MVKKEFLEIVREVREGLPDPAKTTPPGKWDIPEMDPNDLFKVPWELFEGLSDIDEGWIESTTNDYPLGYEDDGGNLHLQPSDIDDIIRGMRPVFEPCAWYQSPHLWGIKWGIYIKESCVWRIANGLLSIE